MSGRDMKLYNPEYNNIKRPYADVDLSKVPSWGSVMEVLEVQALEAKRQTSQKFSMLPDYYMMPQTIINYEHHSSPYNYTNSSNSREESENSSCCSDEMMSTEPSSPLDLSQSESDIEIDVDSIEEDSETYSNEEESEDDFIPITVLHLETKLREKELKRRWAHKAEFSWIPNVNY